MDPDAIEAVTRVTSELDIDDPRSQPPQPGPRYDEVPPPPPQLHSQGVVATEITELFTHASEQLEVGQIVKDVFFTLFESVGAIEIMDPKMDTGYLEAGQTMEDDYDIGRALLPEEVLGIIDQLLCLEMAWHMGHPLSQTIFTSLYIDRLINLNSSEIGDFQFGGKDDNSDTQPLTLQVLRAYCLGLIKTCWHVNNRVKSEHFYEEEDFVTYTYHRTLLDNVETGPIFELLAGAQQALSTAVLESSEVCDALQKRLAFRVAFLNTVSKSDDRGYSGLQNLWKEMLSLLPGINTFRDLAKAVPEAFSVKLQRKLASTVPPRPVVSVAFETAYDHLKRMCNDGQAMTEVFNYYDSHSLMTFVLLFQQRKPQPSVYIRTLLQHYLFGDLLILGRMSTRQLLDDDLSTLVLPASPLLDPSYDDVELPTDPRFNIAKRMDLFRTRAAHSYLDILRTMCQNRCRIRRTLTHTIADWDNLQLDAEEIDQELRAFTNEEPIIESTISSSPLYAFPLSSWAYWYKLRQMEWIVQMGFELEVYQPDELAGMYWYLQFLTQTRIRHLERIRGFVLRRYNAIANSGTSTNNHNNNTITKGRSHKHGRKSSHDSSSKEAASAATTESLSQTLSYLSFTMLEATATSGLADALSALYTILTRLDLIPATPMPYATPSARHELRMKPFHHLVLPEYIPYPAFHAAVSQPHDSTAHLLTFVTAAASRARKDLELLLKVGAKEGRFRGSEEAWRDNVKRMVRSCIAVGIVGISVGKGIGDQKVKLEVEIPAVEKAYHEWWVVPKVTVKS